MHDTLRVPLSNRAESARSADTGATEASAKTNGRPVKELLTFASEHITVDSRGPWRTAAYRGSITSLPLAASGGSITSFPQPNGGAWRVQNFPFLKGSSRRQIHTHLPR